MKISILSLNIWNYNDFDNRKPKIVKLVREYNPDVVVFQEIRDDRSKNAINQLEQLNRDLQYEYSFFLPVQNFKKRKNLDHDCIEGLGICSKYRFEKQIIELKRHPDDEFVRKILHAKLHIDKTILNILNVHFSPDDLYAELHLKEVLKTQNNRHRTIIIGDFNYPHKKIISRLSEERGFKSSSDFEYISYPDDRCSYDYILISNDSEFEKFECIKCNISDHKAIFSEIIL